jgi:hypothetical protein
LQGQLVAISTVLRQLLATEGRISITRCGEDLTADGLMWQRWPHSPSIPGGIVQGYVDEQDRCGLMLAAVILQPEAHTAFNQKPITALHEG